MKIIGFAKYTAPILAAFEDLGIEAKLEGRNDLTIKGMKFSGNARAVYPNKIHQHGDSLFFKDYRSQCCLEPIL